VSPKCHASNIASRIHRQAGRPIQKLDHDPLSEHDPRRKVEDKNKEPGQDTGSWIQQKVSA